MTIEPTPLNVEHVTELEVNREAAKFDARNGLLAFTLYTYPAYDVSWHHRRLAQALNKFESGEIKRLIVTMPPRNGKALAVNTPILTYNRGWTTMGELIPGDEIYHPSGRPVPIVAVSPIWRGRKIYRVSSDDGAEVYADSEHLWLTRLCRKRPKWKIKTTEWLAARKSFRRPCVPTYSSLAAPEVSLPVGPYTLGVWLGDGGRDQATITKHERDIPFLRGRIGAEGYSTTDRAADGTFEVLNLLTLLRTEGLLKNNKHIPDAYLLASESQRLSLLQGLIDTDGYVSPVGQVEFCSMDRQLALDVQQLVRSFGRKASLYTGRAMLNGVDHGTKYRVCFYMENAASLPRKVVNTRNATKQPGRYLIFEDAGHADTICIQVAAEDGLFLAGAGFLVTHNSELVSRRLPAYMLGRNPRLRIIAASYAAELADSMNRDVQRIIDTPVYREIFPDTALSGSRPTPGMNSWVRNSGLFETVGFGGTYRSVGVGGSVTGLGGDRIIVDDPIKNQQEADSQIYRNRVWDWYASTLHTRCEKDAGICVTATRWHEDDLIGRLLKAAAEDPLADQWEVINFPAIAEGEPTALDPRQPGDALWPDRFSLQALGAIKVTQGSRRWTSLYQQRPSPEKGLIVDRVWWRYYGVMPTEFDEIIQAWDLTFKSSDTSDFVAGVVLGRKRADIYLLDLVHARLTFTQTITAMQTLSTRWPHSHVKLVERAANGEALADTLQQVIPGIILVSPKGSKVARANAVSPRIESGNVFLPTAELAPGWGGADGEVVTEWTAFPSGANDDIVDAMSHGLLRFMAEGPMDFLPISLTQANKFIDRPNNGL